MRCIIKLNAMILALSQENVSKYEFLTGEDNITEKELLQVITGYALYYRLFFSCLYF